MLIHTLVNKPFLNETFTDMLTNVKTKQDNK